MKKVKGNVEEKINHAKAKADAKQSEENKKNVGKIIAFIVFFALLVLFFALFKRVKEIYKNARQTNDIVSVIDPEDSSYYIYLIENYSKYKKINRKVNLFESKKGDVYYADLTYGMEFVKDNMGIDPLVLIPLFYHKSGFTNINVGSVNWNIWGKYKIPKYQFPPDTNNLGYNVIMSGFIYSYYYGHTKEDTEALKSYLGVKKISEESLTTSKLYDIIKDYNYIIELSKEYK